MKRAVYAGLGVTAILVVLLIGYGVYLNVSGENALRKWTADYRVPLNGARAQVREIYPMFTLKTVNLTTKRRTDAYALVDGRIEEMLVSKGDAVSAGQPLLRIVDPLLPAKISAADGEIVRAETELVRAQAAYNRYSRLYERKATSQEKMEDAKAAYEAAQASVDIRNAQKESLLVEQSQQYLASPVDGNVVMLYKPVGTFIARGTPLALIGDYHALEFSLPLADSMVRDTMATSMEISVPVSALDRKYGKGTGLTNLNDNLVFPLTVADVKPPLSEPSAVRTLTYEIDNSSGILEAKAYRNFTLHGRDPVRFVTVPFDAMLNDLYEMNSDTLENEVFVYRPEDGTIERRKVKVYTISENYVAIESGLEEGEIVITSDQTGLKDGIKVSVTMERGEE